MKLCREGWGRHIRCFWKGTHDPGVVGMQWLPRRRVLDIGQKLPSYCTCALCTVTLFRHVPIYHLTMCFCRIPYW